MTTDIIETSLGFQWDEGNGRKNWDKHSVAQTECEEAFFNSPLWVFDDAVHSAREKRYYLLGKTNKKRALFVVFTFRHNLIRVISARDMSRKEKVIYEKTQKDSII